MLHERSRTRHGRLTNAKTIERADLISDWSTVLPAWADVAIGPTGAESEARCCMAVPICYLAAVDHISNKSIFANWKLLNDARGNDVNAWLVSDGRKGKPFTVHDGRVQV